MDFLDQELFNYVHGHIRPTDSFYTDSELRITHFFKNRKKKTFFMIILFMNLFIIFYNFVSY